MQKKGAQDRSSAGLFVHYAAMILIAISVHTEIWAMPEHQQKNNDYDPSVARLTHPRESARLFISGHSLTDQPIPDHMAAIAKSLSTPLEWNRQYVVGSSISSRSRGKNAKEMAWEGYRTGFNRSGTGLDVVNELRSPRTVKGNYYDALLITEQHGLLGSLTWHDTVRYLRHYHDRLIEGNSQATTYFYEPWLSLNDKSNPRRWIAYERAASPIWQCIGTRINVSLNAENRSDRIVPLPAGLALANLIDQAIQPNGLSGITLGSTRETVNSIIKDDVHLTDLGSYYIALVSYSVVYGHSPVGAWYPERVTDVQANSLQQTAWAFVTNYLSTNVPLTLDECQSELRTSFIGVYWGYVRDTFWLRESNPISAYIRWLQFVLKWHWLVRQSTEGNPFHFQRETDQAYWFPAP